MDVEIKQTKEIAQIGVTSFKKQVVRFITIDRRQPEGSYPNTLFCA